MKYVYLFSEGNKDMRELLGGKGANLAEMINMGLPVPNGFTVTTEACNKYYTDNEEISDDIKKEILDNLTKLEEITGKKIGNAENPLLLSVRSGSPVSMPGMMDTILNLGLNDDVAKAIASNEDNMRFIYDSYRRLIMMYANVVKGVDKDEFETILLNRRRAKGIQTDLELTAEDMYELAIDFKKLYKKLVKSEFPQDIETQLIEAVTAVFRSWNNDRAKVYRQMNNISETLGTAVNVQEMVYGNLTDDSLTGVAFSRNPANGEDKLYGEFLEKAQGEDIVAGVRTPKSIEAMERDYPNIYSELKDISKLLEKHYKDMQDMEFTVEKGKLYMLQTRSGKRTPLAALNIAVSEVEEGLITKEEALMRVSPENISELLHPTFNEESVKKASVITKGLPASPGAVSGKIYFDVESVKEASNNNIPGILVRNETSAEDIEGMNKAVGVLTVRGGMTSHAAVVARGIGRCCVSGCENLVVDEENKYMMAGSKKYNEGDEISLDGTSGTVYEGVIETTDANLTDNFKKFLSWAKEVKKLKVKANADTPKDAKKALEFGAEGLGLCRTEHMFFEKDKIFAIRKMILARSQEERQFALNELLPMQQKDFEGLFMEMKDLPVIIRYLDPPLHEFLPKTSSEIDELAKYFKVSTEELEKEIADLKEVNPMMGHRGCRLAVTYPEIAIMQTTAIINAALKCLKKGIDVKPEIMIPLTTDLKEFNYLKELIDKTAEEIMTKHKIKVAYKVGTMIEVPRSAILANEIATKAEFFSFGTNDLTQMTFGLSRDDARFLNTYYEKGIFKNDPFKTIDKNGVGKLMIVASKLARQIKPEIELGICGEHGGDAESIKFCHKIGLDYVSCSPYRVPVAILAAAQASLEGR